MENKEIPFSEKYLKEMIDFDIYFVIENTSLKKRQTGQKLNIGAIWSQELPDSLDRYSDKSFSGYNIYHLGKLTNVLFEDKTDFIISETGKKEFFTYVLKLEDVDNFDKDNIILKGVARPCDGAGKDIGELLDKKVLLYMAEVPPKIEEDKLYTL